jgi:hypothetical protein
VNVVPSVIGRRVAGKHHAEKTFPYQVKIVSPISSFGSSQRRDCLMWCFLHSFHCDAPSAARTHPEMYVFPASRARDRPNRKPQATFLERHDQTAVGAGAHCEATSQGIKGIHLFGFALVVNQRDCGDRIRGQL